MSQKDSNPLFAFFGTPRFGVRVLDALERHGLLPTLVVTAPDKKQGRGLTLKPSPVKEWAQMRDIEVITPESLKEIPAELQNTEWDVFVVAAYAKLLSKEVLELPRRGCLNVHPSLLPKFRGPSPALSTILANLRQTGVSIMQMDEKMDHGPIVAQARIEFGEDEWPLKGSVLEDLLAEEGGNLLAEVMPPWVAGEITPQPQNEEEATYTKKFTDEDARIDLQSNPREQFLKIRAFDKNPRAYFVAPSDKRVIVTDALFQNGELQIVKVIPEGKKEMLYSDFMRGLGNHG